jgi:mRNA interferase RelE/StbE
MKMCGADVPYSLQYHPSVKSEDIPGLDKRTKERIKRAIETRLAVAPQDYGVPLRKTLKGYWKLRVGDYRIAFKIQAKKILILRILHRKDVYNIVEKHRA